jgi:hypothetical protein
VPVLSLGWNSSNSAALSRFTSSALSVSDLIWMDAVSPVPTVCTVAGSFCRVSLKTSVTCSVEIVPLEPCEGSWILVPPSNSMPRLNQRNTIDTRQISISAPKMTYQRLCLPTMSN